MNTGERNLNALWTLKARVSSKIMAPLTEIKATETKSVLLWVIDILRV
jgi:hypothetical protein